MNWKKALAVLPALAVLTSSVGFATVPSHKIGIGNVTPGMAVADLVAAYGQPDNKIGDNWYYSNFKIEVDKKDVPTTVNEVSSRNKTLGTPGGVKIGQDAMILNTAYGPADAILSENGVEEYEYFNEDYTKKMTFTTLNQIIVNINCETID